MWKILKFSVIPVFLLISAEGSQLLASDLSQLKPYLKKTVTWKCTTQEKVIPMSIYFLGGNGDEGPDGSEVIVYVKNSAWERIGQESDLSILTDYILKKFIVITVDFGNDVLAVSPRFDQDLHEIFKSVYGYKTESLLKDLGLTPKEYRCFFLPEGYRVATDLVFWEIDKHAAFGTMEYIMNSYNEDIVPKLPGLQPVTSPKDMVDRYGKPFDFTVKLDIVYPSQAKKKVPAIIFSAWISTRNPNGEPIGYLPHFAGFTMRGYAYIVMGHCFNPCVVHYFHYGKFTLDHWNGFACYSAAMRYVNASAGKYSINTDHIGMAGHSKGEYAITRLSDPHHEGGKELGTFEGFPEGSPEPQPWPGYPSNIAAGYQSMGMGLFEPQFITSDYVPTIVACGENERDEISKEAHPAFVRRLEELDVNYINLFMQGLGHAVPYGYDDKMGIDRYRVMADFYDRYLRVEDKLPPVVLIVSPRDREEDIPPSGKIIVDFAPVINPESIIKEKGIRIVRVKNNNEVAGTWKISHKGSRYTFLPAEDLTNNEQYTIEITTSVKDMRGIHLEEEKKVNFTVASE
jgi:hypothetical protein